MKQIECAERAGLEAATRRCIGNVAAVALEALSDLPREHKVCAGIGPLGMALRHEVTVPTDRRALILGTTVTASNARIIRPTDTTTAPERELIVALALTSPAWTPGRMGEQAGFNTGHYGITRSGAAYEGPRIDSYPVALAVAGAVSAGLHAMHGVEIPCSAEAKELYQEWGMRSDIHVDSEGYRAWLTHYGLCSRFNLPPDAEPPFWITALSSHRRFTEPREPVDVAPLFFQLENSY